MTWHNATFLFFFKDTATTEIYTLSLHDALPIGLPMTPTSRVPAPASTRAPSMVTTEPDRKSTRLISSHRTISYAVFCLKKKKKKKPKLHRQKINKKEHDKRT